MPGIRIEGDIQNLISTIRDLGDMDFLVVSQVLGEANRTSTVERFKDEEDPQGKKWKKSIRATEEGGQTLTNKSDLKNSIKSKASEEGFVVGTNKIYAGTHQKGGTFTIRAKNAPYLRFKYKGKWISKKQVTVDMPKREFLGISKEDMQEIKATLVDFVRGNIND